MSARIIIIWLTMYALVGCSNSPVARNDFYGEYREKSRDPDGIVWEGDIVRIDKSGYSHVRFTDEIGVHPDEPPWKEYRGQYSVSGNRIILLKSHLESPERFLVKSGQNYFLLTAAEYQRYKNIFYGLPKFPLTREAP